MDSLELIILEHTSSRFGSDQVTTTSKELFTAESLLFLDPLTSASTVQDDPFFYESVSVEKTPTKKASAPVKCEVCGEVFDNRSKKFYHKSKFEKGTGCNVPTARGRPPYETEEERIAHRLMSRQKRKMIRKQ